MTAAAQKGQQLAAAGKHAARPAVAGCWAKGHCLLEAALTHPRDCSAVQCCAVRCIGALPAGAALLFRGPSTTGMCFYSRLLAESFSSQCFSEWRVPGEIFALGHPNHLPSPSVLGSAALSAWVSHGQKHSVFIPVWDQVCPPAYPQGYGTPLAVHLHHGRGLNVPDK